MIRSSTTAEHREGDEQRTSKLRISSSISDGVAGDRDQKAAVVAEIDGALDQAQALVLRTLHIALAGAARARRHRASSRCGRVRIPQRARRAHLGLAWIEPRHLPVPARQRQLEQRLAERSAGASRWLRRGWRRRRRGAEINAEPAVERALDGVAIERGQHDAGDDQDHHGPDRRREEQAQRERISAHRAG